LEFKGKMAGEEYLIRLGMLEQEANKLQEQFQLVEQQIQEFEILRLSLEKLDETEEKAILANLGRGIYFKTELKDKNLFVNVGNGIVLRKTPQETVEIIEKQINQLQNLRQNLEKQIGNMNLQVQDLVESARGEKA
jgi:prefoldin alpha subunit